MSDICQLAVSKLQHSSKPLPSMSSFSVIQTRHCKRQLNQEQNYFLSYSRYIRKIKWTNVLKKDVNRKELQTIPLVNWKIQLTRTQFSKYITDLAFICFIFLNEVLVYLT